MPLEGTVGGRFRLERVVGTGAMGEVYRALDLDTHTPVAVKVLTAAGESNALRFEREARLLAQLEHPSIVKAVSQGTTPTGAAYLVMEWLDGEDLRSRLARGALSLADAVEIAREIAEALSAAHEAGVVHRDLKP